MPLVSTEIGLIDKSRLQVTDMITVEDNARVTATEWRLEGKMVRRDVWVNALRGLEMNGKAA